jgi:hypothetical protein
MSLKDSDILNLPEAPDFISVEPVLPLAEFIALCEKNLPTLNAKRFANPEAKWTGEPFRLFE